MAEVSAGRAPVLAGKVAFITGGASGMGAATARLFAAQGATVVTADINEPRTDASPAPHFVRLDVGNEAAWRAAVRQVMGQFGRIDCLINCAGIVRFGDFLDQPLAEVEQVLRVNLLGPAIGMKVVGRVMVAQGSGAIVNISSTAAQHMTNGGSAYSASKAGLTALSRAAAHELGHRGVRVNVVVPGLIDTPLVNPGGGDLSQTGLVASIPLQRVGRPEEIARMCLFLVSEDSAYCNGGEFAVDGGAELGKYVSFLPGAPRVT